MIPRHLSLTCRDLWAAVAGPEQRHPRAALINTRLQRGVNETTGSPRNSLAALGLCVFALRTVAVPLEIASLTADSDGQRTQVELNFTLSLAV
jgi:hypothetical protein